MTLGEHQNNRIFRKREIPTECWSRTVGFFRPVEACNPGKKAEIKDRKLFDVNNKEKIYPEWNTKKTVKV